jgi:hypothetical protein
MKKMLVIYSESHRSMYADFFLPSFDRFLAADYDLRPLMVPQTSKDGGYETKGFNVTVRNKISLIIENIKVGDPYELCVSDCDVQFFAPLVYDLREKDLLMQWDCSWYCAGFMIMRQSQPVKDFFIAAGALMDDSPALNDQHVINMLLNNYSLRADRLPVEKYWTIGNFNGGKGWRGEDFTLPAGIIMHHANFTYGVENKLKLLEKVKQLHG